MTDRSEKRLGSRWGRFAKAVGLRVAVWGGVAGLVFLVFGDVRPMIFPRRISSIQGVPQAAPRPAGGAVAVGKKTAEDTQSWPQLRGPKHDGCSGEIDLADRWPAEGPPLLWIRDLGRGYSSFAAVGDRIYTQTQGFYAQSVVCLEADTGRTIWEQRYDWPYDAAGMYPGPRATPSWYEGRIYYASPQGRVGCLNAEDGRPIWSVNLVEKFDGEGHDFGYSCSPLVEDGLVIMPVGGKGASVVALKADDGSTAWASGDEPASYCTAKPVTLERRRCVVAFLENALALLDLRSGRLLWQRRFTQGYNEHAAAPLYQEPYLMTANPFQGGAELFRLKLRRGPEPAAQVESVWASPGFSNDVASSVLLDGFVYGFDIRDPQARPHRPSRGQFKCLELLTGKVRWASDRPGHAGPLAADGKLFMLNDAGEIVLARASPRSYEELGRAKVFPGEICWTAPALGRGRLFLRSPTQAACVLVGNSESAAAGSLPATRSAVIRTPWRINWNWVLGGEREYPFDPPTVKELGNWYFAAVFGSFLPAAIAALALWGLLRLLGMSRADVLGEALFWTASFVLGIATSAVANRLGSAFIFTWPVCLVVAQQFVLAAIIRQHGQAGMERSPFPALAAGLAFVAVCLGYFHACRQTGLALQWCFLMGFAPSLPAAVVAAWWLARRPRVLRDSLLAVVVFTLFFWAGGGYMLWRGFR